MSLLGLLITAAVLTAVKDAEEQEKERQRRGQNEAKFYKSRNT